MITLKNIKINKQLSEETACFSATVYFRGKKAGTVGNRGCGGPNDYHLANYDEVAKYATANGTATEFSPGSGMIHNPTLHLGDSPIDDFVHQELDRFEELKQYKTWCRTQVVFQISGDDTDAFRTIKTKWTQKVLKHLCEKYGSKLLRILNQDLYGEPKS